MQHGWATGKMHPSIEAIAGDLALSLPRSSVTDTCVVARIHCPRLPHCPEEILQIVARHGSVCMAEAVATLIHSNDRH